MHVIPVLANSNQLSLFVLISYVDNTAKFLYFSFILGLLRIEERLRMFCKC